MSTERRHRCKQHRERSEDAARPAITLPTFSNTSVSVQDYCLRVPDNGARADKDMGEYTELLQTIALTLGVAWASGINLYAAVAVLGIGGATGYVELPAELSVVQDPLVIVAAALMYCVEFMADKIPGVDSAWDSLHTFVRIPAGAMLAAGAAGSVDPAIGVAAGLLGGTLTAATHATKAGARVLINTSPEPFSNFGISIAEDIAVFTGLWVALTHPVLFLVALAAFLILLCLL